MKINSGKKKAISEWIGEKFETPEKARGTYRMIYIANGWK